MLAKSANIAAFYGTTYETVIAVCFELKVFCVSLVRSSTTQLAGKPSLVVCYRSVQRGFIGNKNVSFTAGPEPSVRPKRCTFLAYPL